MEHIEESLKIDAISKFGKDFVNKAPDKIHSIMHNSAEKISNKIVKKPNKDADSSVFEKYRQKKEKVETIIKTGELLLASRLIPVGIDLVVAAAVVDRLSKSDIKSDQNVARVYTKLKEKGKKLKYKTNEFMNKFKNKKKDEINEEEYKKNYMALDSMATSLAKQIDTANNIQNNINESTEYYIEDATQIMESVKNILMNDNKITLESYEAVQRFIERADYSNNRDVLIAETCIDILLKEW